MVAEGVQRLAARKLARAQVVLALIEVSASLVILEQIDRELQLAFVVGGDHRRLP